MRWHWPPQLSIAFYMLVPIGLLIALSLKLGRLIRRHEALSGWPHLNVGQIERRCSRD
jgi:hypothetical protein